MPYSTRVTDWQRFRELLGTEHEWPCRYTFKFVVPAAKSGDVKELFNPGSTTSRPSKNGNYVSLTAVVLMASPDDVITVYERASRIEGLLAL
ncbi:MAG: DUF493 domain-containing protein [Myxococcota bacterium]